MFFPEGQLQVYLYGQPADLRCSFDGLQALVRQGLGQDPLSGALYVFINRRGNQVRVLYFDRSGFCLWAQRLEAGRFISDWRNVRHRSMDWTGLKLLLEGIEPARRRKRFSLPQTMQNSVHSSMPAVNCSDVTTTGVTNKFDTS
jgi:transposase